MSAFENTVGKGEIARNEQFFFFPQYFLPFWRTFCHFHQVQNYQLQTLSVWKSLKFFIWERDNTLQNNKILDWTKLKAFADVKLNVSRKIISLFDRVEKIVGKGEYGGYHHFLLFPQCFPKLSSLGSLKVGSVWYRVN